MPRSNLIRGGTFLREQERSRDGGSTSLSLVQLFLRSRSFSPLCRVSFSLSANYVETVAFFQTFFSLPRQYKMNHLSRSWNRNLYIAPHFSYLQMHLRKFPTLSPFPCPLDSLSTVYSRSVGSPVILGESLILSP